MHRRLWLLIACIATLVLSACKVDTTVVLHVNADGSGSIALTLTADAELVGKAPGLADELRFDDAKAAGWEVTGPTKLDGGGLEVKLHHDFTSPEQATALLQSLNGSGGPLHDVQVTRVVAGNSVKTSVQGTLRVDGGLDAFADPDLLAAIGGTPYAADVAAANLAPAQVVGITVRLELPGGAQAPTGTVAADGASVWQVPLDGTAQTLTVTATQTHATANVWSAVSTGAFVVLVLWILLAGAFIVFVVMARRRRALRHPRPRR